MHCGALVANIDVAPTLLDLAGMAVPERMQGRSLRPLLADPSRTVRDELLYSYYFEPPYPTPTVQALVTPGHKLIRQQGHAPELYEVGADPREQRNVYADADPALRDALGARLDMLAGEQR